MPEQVAPFRHEQAARDLYDAEMAGVPIEPLTATHPGLTVGDAYSVQLAGRKLREAVGVRLEGWKIGLTSQAMQEMLNVDQPDFGYLTREMLHESGGVIPCGKLIAPRVEGELAFRMRSSLVGPDVGIEQALDAIGEVAPALEIIDSRIEGWRVQIVDTVADNASSGCAVLGSFVPLGDLDLASVEMRLTVRDRIGEEAVVTGRGEAVLGHPAEAVAWLARALATYGGEQIAAGDVVLSGAVARALPVAAGAQADATFTNLGSAGALFERELA